MSSKGLLALVHELPEGSGLEITSINFSREPSDEAVAIGSAAPGARAVDVFDATTALEVGADGRVRIQLDAYEGRAFHIKR